MSDAERLRLLIDSLKDYALVTFDTQNRIVSWNIGAERLLGYTEQEALGRFGDIFFTSGDQAKREVERELQTAAREGRAQDERWHRRKDESLFWGSGLMYAVRDDAGQLRGYVKIFRDTTDRRNIEIALKEREEQLRLLVDNVRDYALIQLDANGCVSAWNPGAVRMFGYGVDEIVGKPLDRLFMPEEVQSGYLDNELQRTVAQGGVEDERWLVRKDGTRLFVRWITNAMLDDSGHLRGFVKVLHDETERKQQQQLREHRQAQQTALLKSEVATRTEALDRTKEELRRLAASLLTAQEEERSRIARELHDDVSQRLARLELLIAGIRDDIGPEASVIKGDLAHLSDEIAELSRDVRNLSHRLHPSMLDELGLAVALRALVETFASYWPQPVTFDMHDVPDHVPAEASYALYRIAQEGLRNIQKHAPAATVNVVLSATAGDLHLTMTDSGPGFDQGGRPTERGLGLLSMHERALLAGGRFVIDSRPGNGTRIEVRVPLTKPS
jgi:PAS domain S-box-containing protein